MKKSELKARIKECLQELNEGRPKVMAQDVINIKKALEKIINNIDRDSNNYGNYKGLSARLENALDNLEDAIDLFEK